GRLAMDTYFKTCRAKEEIERLNIEIRQVLTYLHNEERYLCACAAQLQPDHPSLCHQILQRLKVRARFTPEHLFTLQKLTSLKGFSGSLTIGQSARCELGDSASTPKARVPTQHDVSIPQAVSDEPGDFDEGWEEEEEEEEELAEHVETLHNILQISDDHHHPHNTDDSSDIM
ncbi:hypothetical protein HYDPIDRAFT_101227, partial [Hydnomerulius pinastri MD-312]